MAEVGVLKERLPALEAEGARLGDELGGILATIPNLPLADVPEGADENDNVEVALHGTPPTFDRSEERRVGKECVRTCRSRWSPYHYNKNQEKQNIYAYVRPRIKTYIYKVE